VKIVFFGKGARACACLERLLDDERDVVAVVTHPYEGPEPDIVRLARARTLPVHAPADPNAESFIERLESYEAELFILGGYGPILRKRTLELPRVMSVNLHAGKLPEYRGSSPMNWALINGESSFSLSIIAVDPGVDTGDVLADRELQIGEDDTIVDLHGQANALFPEMLSGVLRDLDKGTLERRVQDAGAAAYLPLRFPDDGFVLWDMLSAEQVHNRIRALTRPYPCAFTYLDGRRVDLFASERAVPPFFGEPGRVYRKTKRGLLVCAADRCLWITRAKFSDDASLVSDSVCRYVCFETVRGHILRSLRHSGER